MNQLGPLLRDLTVSDIVGFDVETSSLDWITCKLYTIQLYLNDNTFVIDCLKFGPIKYLMELISVKKLVGHNIKYDTKVILAKTGVLIPDVYDTMLAEVMCYQGIGKKFYSLAELVLKYHSIELDKEVRKSFYELGDLTELSQEQLMYAARDVQYLFGIRDEQLNLLESQKQLRVLDLEMRLVPVVAKMEHTGILMDTERWSELMNVALQEAQRTSELLKDLILKRIDYSAYATMFDLYDALSIPVKTKKEKSNLQSLVCSGFFVEGLRNDINLASPKQLQSVFRILGIDLESTGEKILKEYKGEDELITLLLLYREYNKKASSFGESFLNKIHPVTGRLHSEFNQLMADTGRFSSSNPNMQQIVRDSDYRHCFIATPGFVMITCDYSQQELRLAGAITQEDRFIEAFLNNQDLHALTASVIYGVPFEEVTKEQRQVAKGYNFAVLYGSTEYGLAYNFQMPIEQARDLLDKFYKGYPKLAQFKTLMEDAIQQRKFSSTPLGRKRFFEDKKFFIDHREMERYTSTIRRQGFNHLVQGGGADVTKLALVEIHENNPYGEALRIIMPVHDEIVVEVREDLAEEGREFIVKCMVDVFQPFLGNIPAEASSEIGPTWSK